MAGDCGRDGIDTLKNLARGLGIGNLELVGLVERHDQLKGVHGIQAEAAGAEEGLVVWDVGRGDLEHEVLHHQPFDVLFKRSRVIHYKMPPSTIDETVSL